MPYLLWRCPACSQSEETPPEALCQRLRGAGLLRRVAAEEAQDFGYLLELANSVKGKLICPACGAAGYLPERPSEDEAGWGGGKRCAGCGAAISAERLEVFPDTTLCPACQKKAERGDSGPEEYCPHCGTPLRLRPSRRGIAGYEMACPGCGKRAR